MYSLSLCTWPVVLTCWYDIIDVNYDKRFNRVEQLYDKITVDCKSKPILLSFVLIR